MKRNFRQLLVAIIILLVFSFIGYSVEKIEVPLAAVEEAKYSQLTASQLTKEKVTVPKSWVKKGWLEQNRGYVQKEEKQNEYWTKKWKQQPPPKFTKKRVDNPELYNIQGLRVNADFKVDLGEWWSKVEQKTYWVPAAKLGTPDLTKEGIEELTGKPEQAKKEIDVLYEALAFMHMGLDTGSGNLKTRGANGINWQFPKPAELAIEDGKANCAASSNIIRYLLEEDYEEVGFVWRHTTFSTESPSGHCTSYIKHQGEYYFFDPVSLTEERSKYPVEDGDGRGYQVDQCDRLIQTTPRKYAIFWSQLARSDEAIFALFTTPYKGHFALGKKDRNLYYPQAFDGANLTIWTDPDDPVELLQASYSPTPPSEYASYPPYNHYSEVTCSCGQGKPDFRTMPSDG